jgi:hypothetical protein
MSLPACVACERPVLELDGQFDKLDSYLIERGAPPEDSAGWWHAACLRASNGRGKTLAIGRSGELVDLSIGRKRQRSVDGGVVVARVEDEYHLQLDRAALVAEMQDTLTATTVYPVLALFAALDIGEKVADRVALEGAVLRHDKGLAAMWQKKAVSVRLEYGVFIPIELEPHLGDRVR